MQDEQKAMIIGIILNIQFQNLLNQPSVIFSFLIEFVFSGSSMDGVASVDLRFGLQCMWLPVVT